jgi:hypothetical protein
MKAIYTVGIAALFGIGVAWWVIEREEEGNATPVQTSNNLDSNDRSGSGVEQLRQMASTQPEPPSRGSTGNGLDGSGSGAAAPPAGQIPPSTHMAGQGTQPSREITQVAESSATMDGLGRLADEKSSAEAPLDKRDCEAAARTLRESKGIFDVTPTLVVHFAWSPPYPHANRSGFEVLQSKLLGPLCSGNDAFSADYVATLEFVAVSPDSHVRLLVGDSWISDGTVVSPFPPDEYDAFMDPSRITQTRRRQGMGPGANISRESFEKQLARNPLGLIGRR